MFCQYIIDECAKPPEARSGKRIWQKPPMKPAVMTLCGIRSFSLVLYTLFYMINDQNFLDTNDPPHILQLKKISVLGIKTESA
jgi:hypothetical protein